MKILYSGKCLCGAVSYEVADHPVVVAQCHCQECRKLSGTGHSIGAMFAIDAVKMRGELNRFKYESSLGSDVTKASCATCNCPIYGTNSRTPEFMTLALGSMEEADGLRVDVVIFARDKTHWDGLEGEVVTFETQPEWSPKS